MKSYSSGPVLHPAGIEEVCQTLELLGSVTGEKEKARQVIAAIEAQIEVVQEKLRQLPDQERVRVYYQVYHDPLMTAGGASVIHEIIEMAGGENVFADVQAAYPQVSSESVIERDPEVILFPNYHGTEEVPVSEVVGRPGWGTITAIQKERIFGLDPDKVSRPGLRLAEAVMKWPGFLSGVMVRPTARLSVCAAGAASWHAETNFDAIDKNKGRAGCACSVPV